MLLTFLCVFKRFFIITELKDEEVEYLKSKIQEAIDEYEGVRRREMAVKDENNRLLLEVLSLVSWMW